MAIINPYLNFDGNTEEAFKFYKSVFGGEFTVLQRFKDTDEGHIPASDQEKIMHISLPIGKENMLMGTDIAPAKSDNLCKGNNFHLSFKADSEEEGMRLFEALSEGGKITMPLYETTWGAMFGMLTDKFGIQWMINFDDPNIAKKKYEAFEHFSERASREKVENETEYVL